MEKESLKVDRKKFEGIVKNLLQGKPLKREKVKVSKKKPDRILPPIGPFAKKPEKLIPPP